MAVLSDRDIKGYLDTGGLTVKPLFPDTVRENGLDLRLGGRMARMKDVSKVFDPLEDGVEAFYEMEEGNSFIIHPGEHILFHTLEYIKLPKDLVGFITLRSSYARLGLSIPPTIVDAWFEGQLTIGMIGGAFPIHLHKGERMIHLILAKLSTPVGKPYRGKYRAQRGIQLPIFDREGRAQPLKSKSGGSFSLDWP